ncbi:hypothetical protein KKB69_01760 [Patescibacteria group bacterium]|nr:hypothetical protein [Patescibacteria group bacterium]
MTINNKKFLISVILAVVLNLAFCFLAYLLARQINFKKNSFLETKNSIYFYEQRIKNIKDIKKELALRADKQNDIKLAFLNESSIVDFIERIEYLAKKAGVELKTRRADIAGGVEEKPVFDISLKGAFSNIYFFVSLLENDKYQLSFQRVYIQNPKLEKYWEADLELRLLSFEND